MILIQMSFSRQCINTDHSTEMNAGAFFAVLRAVDDVHDDDDNASCELPRGRKSSNLITSWMLTAARARDGSLVICKWFPRPNY